MYRACESKDQTFKKIRTLHVPEVRDPPQKALRTLRKANVFQRASGRVAPSDGDPPELWHTLNLINLIVRARGGNPMAAGLSPGFSVETP